MKKKETYQRLLLQDAMRKELSRRWYDNLNFERLKKMLVIAFLGLFCIAIFLGFILLVALSITHPLSLFILCGTIGLLALFKTLRSLR